VTIDSYGGNPDIVATREEIQRVATQIKLAAEELSAFGTIETLLSDPLHQLQYRVSTIGLLAKLEKLYGSCLLASEQYFSTEAQIHRRFEIHFVPAIAAIGTSVAMSMGWRLDHAVSATVSSKRQTLAPTSITAMLDRLWDVSSKTDPTVGIDLFENKSGSRTVIVYIPGTQTLGLGDGVNPLDLQSNILAMQGEGLAASERAVLEAMKQAGVLETDSVIFVGHSQGGMVAGNLSQNPTGYLAAGLVAVGAPIAQLKLAKIPVMAIEHVNDPVPNASGKANPLAKNWVTVQRKAMSSESDAPLHSHSLKSYRNTTEKVDASKNLGIVNIRQQIMSQLQGSPAGKAFDFVISREF
jgi:hypothetical protein